MNKKIGAALVFAMGSAVGPLSPRTQRALAESFGTAGRTAGSRPLAGSLDASLATRGTCRRSAEGYTRRHEESRRYIPAC